MVFRFLLALVTIVTAVLPLAPATAFAEGMQVTQSDGRLGAVEAFRTGALLADGSVG